MPADYAETFAALSGSNQSANGTAIKENPYPPLYSCAPAGRTCVHDSLSAGLNAIRVKVGGNCVGSDNVNDCAKYVFTKIGSAADQQLFSRFINRPAGFLDGTRSTLLMQDTSGELGSIFAQKVYLKFAGTGITVADFFENNRGLKALAYHQPTSAHSSTTNRELTRAATAE